MRRFLGVLAMSQDYADTANFAANPVVLATHGTVPDQWEELRVAA